MTTRIETIDELFIHELHDLHSAESQLVAALPRMAAAATAAELRQGFETHLLETREQLRRVEHVLENLGLSAGNDVCKGIEGLVAEGEKLIGATERGAVLDAALIDSGRKVEQYEINAYRAAITKARELGFEDAADTLERNLQEEELTDFRLQELAQGMMPYNLEGSDLRDDGSEVVVGEPRM
jgi:ferritin-like metal-binding protein YciE